MSSVRLKPIVARSSYAAMGKQAIEDSLRRTSRLVISDFESTVADWKEKPVFFVRVDDRSITAGTDNQIYVYVNDGTPAHIIRARNAPNLIFRQGGFIPKTQVGRIRSRPGRAANGPMVSKKQVMHPGSEGRHFDRLIAERRQVTLEQDFRQRLAIAARKGQKG